ncbi:MAG: serine hydrolase domain-containing protein [Gammaproteobacteria bacterium]
MKTPRHLAARHGLWCGRLILLALSLCARPGAAAAPDLDDLLRDLNALRRDHGVPGIALTLVSRDSVLWSGGIGYLDRDTRQPVTPDTPHRVEALSGTLVGLAVLLAAERGELSLDDRVRALVPDLPLENPWEHTHPVRIAHLLEHTAGLLDLSADGRSGAPDASGSLRCHWPPGLFPSWSRAGGRLAVAALERSIDQPYADFLERQLLAPLGMRETGLADEVTPAGRPSPAYAADGTGPGMPSGAPGIVSTARELAALLRLLLNGGVGDSGRLLSRASIERLETPLTPLGARVGLAFGAGAGNLPAIHRGFLFHGQGGGAGAQLSHYAYSHRLGLGFVVIINAWEPAALERLRTRLLDFLIGERRPHRPPRAEIDPQQLARLSGRYQSLTWHSAAERPPPLQVLLNDGRLYTRGAGGAPQALVPVSTHLYRREEQPIATVAFVEYGDDVYLQGPFGNYRRAAGKPTDRGTAQR